MTKLEKEAIESVKIVIKKIHATATGYDPDRNLRSDSTLEFICYEVIREALKKHHLSIQAIEDLGAFLMHRIATRHPFFDGNKRTALMTFLIYKYQDMSTDSIAEKIKKHYPKSWDNKNDKIVKFMVELAENKHDYANVLKFVKETFK